MRATASLVLVVTAVALAGCGEKNKSAKPPERRSLPACAHAGSSVASGLPASFPLPRGTVVRSSKTQTLIGRKFRIVSALAPGTIEDALAYLRRLRAAGYRFSESDSEENEAEATFGGHGILQARVRFRTLPECAGAMTLDLGTTPP
jgi:hypothetical protein